MKISVVIPVYNERSTIEPLLSRVQAVDVEKEVIVIDDCSTDGTREFLEQLDGNPTRTPTVQTTSRLVTDNLRLLYQAKNQGKGAALRRGFENARGDVVVIQDADLEYDPQDYHRLLEPIERGLADVVYGSRFLGGPHRVLFFWHYIGNTLLTLLSNMLTNLNLSDVWTCYKVFRVEALRNMQLKEDRFGFEAEVTAKIARAGYRVYEVPIAYYGRTYAEGKKITWKDGFRGVWCTLRYNLMP